MTSWINTPTHRGWRRALVYGLGLSGLAAARLLRAHGVEVIGIDRRDRVDADDLASNLGVRLELGGEPKTLPAGLDWPDIDGVVLSPGVPPERPLLVAARAHRVPVIAEVELAYSLIDGDIVAITGSNGKSTTTALTGAMLRAAGWQVEVCGNIGQPLSSKVLGAKARNSQTKQRKVFVVELSSFQLEGVDRFHADSAALLNLAVDHLDRHDDFAAYRDAKLEIFNHQTGDDTAVVNADDPLVTEVTANLGGRRRSFSRHNPVDDGCWLDGERVVESSPDGEPIELFTTADVPLPGLHNLENAMAAALLSRSRGVDTEALRAGLRTFTGLPHRLELARERAGVRWYNDSKGTNIAASSKSLEGFDDGRVLAILGGRYKGGDLAPLAELVLRKARIAYLIGESAGRFEDALNQAREQTVGDAAAISANAANISANAANPATEVLHVETLERAIEHAEQAAGDGDVVLLSPACSSFDQFTNFAERGRVFKSLVEALPPAIVQPVLERAEQPVGANDGT